MQQATACKTENLSASFSCALKKRFGDANFTGEEMILIDQFLLLDHPHERRAYLQLLQRLLIQKQIVLSVEQEFSNRLQPTFMVRWQ